MSTSEAVSTARSSLRTCVSHRSVQQAVVYTNVGCVVLIRRERIEHRARTRLIGRQSHFARSVRRQVIEVTQVEAFAHAGRTWIDLGILARDGTRILKLFVDSRIVECTRALRPCLSNRGRSSSDASSVSASPSTSRSRSSRLISAVAPESWPLSEIAWSDAFVE